MSEEEIFSKNSHDSHHLNDYISKLLIISESKWLKMIEYLA